MPSRLRILLQAPNGWLSGRAALTYMEKQATKAHAGAASRYTFEAAYAKLKSNEERIRALLKLWGGSVPGANLMVLRERRGSKHGVWAYMLQQFGRGKKRARAKKLGLLLERNDRLRPPQFVRAEAAGAARRAEPARPRIGIWR